MDRRRRSTSSTSATTTSRSTGTRPRPRRRCPTSVIAGTRAALRRGLRTTHRPILRGLVRRIVSTRWSGAGRLMARYEARIDVSHLPGHPRSAGRDGREGAPRARLHERHAGVGRQEHPARRRRRQRGRGPRAGRRDVPPPPRQPGDRSVRRSPSPSWWLSDDARLSASSSSRGRTASSTSSTRSSSSVAAAKHPVPRRAQPAGRRRGGRPGRLRPRRLPAHRRDRPVLAGHGVGRRVRRRGRPGRRHLQRLPGALRGRPAPGRAAEERRPEVPLPDRRPAGREHRHRC